MRPTDSDEPSPVLRPSVLLGFTALFSLVVSVVTTAVTAVDWNPLWLPIGSTLGVLVAFSLTSYRK
jgi:hypothetical protein